MRKNIVLVCLTALAVAGVVPAFGAVKHLITGKQIKNHSIAGVDIKRRTITLSNLKKSTIKSLRGAGQVGNPTTPGAQGENGTAGTPGANGSNGTNGTNAAGVTGPHWGPIDRNTIGSPVQELRNGPFAMPAGAGDAPPFGQGSLGLQVAAPNPADVSTTEKAAFGNELDFNGQFIDDLNQLGFRYYATGEDLSPPGNTRNLPQITIEIDPNLAANPSSNFSSLVYQPPAATTPNRWSAYVDGTTSGDYVLTGAAGNTTSCKLATPCTFAEVKTRLNDNDGNPAKILTVAVSKGRDSAFQGAVDGLRVNNQVFDFESYGVNTLAAP